MVELRERPVGLVRVVVGDPQVGARVDVLRIGPLTIHKKALDRVPLFREEPVVPHMPWGVTR